MQTKILIRALGLGGLLAALIGIPVELPSGLQDALNLSSSTPRLAALPPASTTGTQDKEPVRLKLQAAAKVPGVRTSAHAGAALAEARSTLPSLIAGASIRHCTQRLHRSDTGQISTGRSPPPPFIA